MSMIDDLEDLLRAAVVEVFGTMTGLQVQLEPPQAPVVNPGATIAGAVGFIGRVTGVVYVYAPVELAARLTEKLLLRSAPAPEQDELINDTMGELANMIVGHVKSRLSDRGFACALTIPSIVRGTNFQIELVSSTVRRVSSFRLLDHHLVVELMLRPESPVAATAGEESKAWDANC